jgi:hypothetical protein
VGITDEIDRCGFRSGDDHGAGFRLHPLSRNPSDLLLIEEMQPGPACGGRAERRVGDDLKFLRLLVDGAIEGRRSRQNSNRIGPVVEPHQSVDVPGRGRRSHGPVFEWDNLEKAAPG